MDAPKPTFAHIPRRADTGHKGEVDGRSRKSVAAEAPNQPKNTKRRLRCGAEGIGHVNEHQSMAERSNIRWSAMLPMEMTVSACKATDIELTYRLKRSLS